MKECQMTRFLGKSEQDAGFASVGKPYDTVGHIAPRKALFGVMISLMHGHGQITSFIQSAVENFHIRFEYGASVEFAVPFRDIAAVREFLVRVVRVVN
jgi:hypothetical protein